MIKKIVIAIAISMLPLGIYVYSTSFQDTVNDFIDKEVVKVKKRISKDKDDGTRVVAKPKDVKFSPVNIEKPKGKSVHRLTIDLTRSIFIAGPIGVNALQASMALSKMASESDAPIYIVLSSPGGSVISGAALISAMQVSKAPIYTICYAFCASMASMIHQYGTRRYVTDRTMIMFHPASVQLGGNLDEVYNFTRSTMRYVSQIENDIATRIGWSLADYKRRVNNELWLDSDQAKQDNVVDQIVYFKIPSMFDNIGAINQQMDKKHTKVKGKDLIWIYKGNL